MITCATFYNHAGPSTGWFVSGYPIVNNRERIMGSTISWTKRIGGVVVIFFMSLIDDQMADRQNQNHGNKNNRLRMDLVNIFSKSFGTPLELDEHPKGDENHHQ